MHGNGTALSAPTLEIHRAALLLPEMPPNQYASFKADVKAHGLLEPIKVLIVDDRNLLVDGRQRLRACRELGIEPRIEVLPADTDVLAVIESLNIQRRHLDESQRAMFAARLETYRQGHNRHTLEMPNGMSRSEAAQRLNVGERTVARARIVLDRGAPELIRAVEAGAIPVSTAGDCTKLSAAKQCAIAAATDPKAAARAALMDAERAVIRGRVDLIAARRAKKVQGRYDVIVIDPPWPSHMSMGGSSNGTGYRPYRFPVIPLGEIEDVVKEAVARHAADDCHLFLWAIDTFLPEALRIVENIENLSLGHPRVFVWHKNGGPKPLGLAVYNAEFVVYARKGSPKFIDGPGFNACFEAPRRGAGVKPDEFYDMLRRVTAGRRLDMFNRRKIEGFEGWGLESPGMYVESPQVQARRGA